jgi:hypothetical protein
MGVLYLRKKTEVRMSMFTVSIIFFVVLTVASFGVGMWLQNSEKGK